MGSPLLSWVLLLEAQLETGKGSVSVATFCAPARQEVGPPAPPSSAYGDLLR